MTPAANLLKRELKESYQRLADSAAAHQSESIQFHKLCEEHYGILWDHLPSLADCDPIIDTIDYGTDSLSFEKFDELVVAGIKETDAQEAGV